jgi:hypothetical protein
MPHPSSLFERPSGPSVFTFTSDHGPHSWADLGNGNAKLVNTNIMCCLYWKPTDPTGYGFVSQSIELDGYQPGQQIITACSTGSCVKIGMEVDYAATFGLTTDGDLRITLSPDVPGKFQDTDQSKAAISLVIKQNCALVEGNDHFGDCQTITVSSDGLYAQFVLKPGYVLTDIPTDENGDLVTVFSRDTREPGGGDHSEIAVRVVRKQRDPYDRRAIVTSIADAEGSDI